MTTAEWVLGTAAAITAYTEVGALAVGLIGFRFVPAAIAGLWTYRLGGRVRRELALFVTALARAVAGAAATLAFALDLPFGVIVAIVWLDATAGSAYRPAQAALLPAVVGTPGQLTRAATLTSNAKTVGQVAGALVAGLMLSVSSAPIAVALATALYLGSALLTVSVGPTARAAYWQEPADAKETLRGLLAIRHNRAATRIAAWTSARALLRGVWTALGVIAALELLDMGDSGFGLLMLAAGAGTILAVPMTQALVGRSTLVRPLASGLALCGGVLAAIGLTAAAAAALALMVFWGIGMALSDAAAQGLLNRLVRVPDLPRAVAAIESTKLFAEGAGALTVPGLVALLGVRGALIASGAAALLAVAADLPGLLRIEGVAAARMRVLGLVRGVELFAPLRLDGLEAVAARLRIDRRPAGATVVRQDEPGNRWYLVAAGELEVTIDGHQVSRLGAGLAFGERALLRGEPRSATVTACTEVELLSLDRADFMAAVVGVTPLDAPAPLAPAATPLDALRRQPLLQGASRASVAALERAATTIELPAGELVVREGDHDDRWLVVLDGELEVDRGDRPPRRLGPGDALGEIGVLHQIPRTASVVARTRVIALAIPGSELRSVVPADGAAPKAG